MNGMIFHSAKLFIWEMAIRCWRRGVEIALNKCHLVGYMTQGNHHISVIGKSHLRGSKNSFTAKERKKGRKLVSSTLGFPMSGSNQSTFILDFYEGFC